MKKGFCLILSLCLLSSVQAASAPVPAARPSPNPNCLVVCSTTKAPVPVARPLPNPAVKRLSMVRDWSIAEIKRWKKEKFKWLAEITRWNMENDKWNREIERLNEEMEKLNKEVDLCFKEDYLLSIAVKGLNINNGREIRALTEKYNEIVGTLIVSIAKAQALRYQLKDEAARQRHIAPAQNKRRK